MKLNMTDLRRKLPKEQKTGALCDGEGGLREVEGRA